jgi:hypothetical protein
MTKLFRLLILLILPVFFEACDTDFDVITDYKEVAIVYGLLNQTDTVHYLRINKAFLGPGNALTYAQVADSSSFGADIDVILSETTPGGIKKDTVTLYTKEPGDFYSPGQLFYSSKAVLNENNSYTLTVTNKKTSNVVSSQTPLIHNFEFTQPAYRPPPFPPITLSFLRANTSVHKFIWNNAENGKRYQLKLYFNYKELGLSGDTTDRMVEWVFPATTTENTNGKGESDVAYLNEDFYYLCESKIPYSDAATEEAVIQRFASVCDLKIEAIGDEFNTYLLANGPTTGVLMDKPSYSNIKNGLGILSCTYQIQRIIALSPETIFDLSTTTNLKFSKPY